MKKPPKIAKWLLTIMIDRSSHYSYLGDVEELYNDIAIEKGVLRAKSWYVFQVGKSMPAYVKNSFNWNVLMFKNYIKIALRNMKKQKTFSFINISGLALGMTCSLLMILYVLDDLSFDTHYENADRIYRVASEYKNFSDEKRATARTPQQLAEILGKNFPEVESAARLRRTRVTITKDNTSFREDGFLFADPEVFTIFAFDFVEGSPQTAFDDPNSIVITESTAGKYFGNTNAMGKTLSFSNEGDLTVTGIIKDIPQNSHFTFSILGSYDTLISLNGGRLQPWDNFVTSTYLLLSEGKSPDLLESKFKENVLSYVGNQRFVFDIMLDPVTSIYLHTGLNGELGVKGDITYVYIFSAIAFFILLIACLNFMSLSTARSADRANEVGVRKVFGAHRQQLIKQFLSEAVLIATTAFIFSLVMTSFFLPFFNDIAGKQLAFNLQNDILLIALLLVAAIGLGLFSGSYPALLLSSFRSVNLFKGRATPGSGGVLLRKAIVVFQFAATIVFIMGTLTVYNQLHYLSSKNLGFNKEQIIVSRMSGSAKKQYEALKNELSNTPGIRAVSASYHTPGQGLGMYYYKIGEATDYQDIATNMIDYDFVDTYEMNIAKGRNFSKDFASDVSSFLLNETAVRTFGWEEPIGKTINFDGTKQGEVIGVVTDFHFRSMHHNIQPMILQVDPDYYNRLSIRMNAENISETIEAVKTVWQKFDTESVFSYTFVDEDFSRYYTSERKVAVVLNYASGLAIIVGVMGLLGLSIYALHARIKEIGIRKILGADLMKITYMLYQDFLMLVCIAFMVGFPLSYVVANKWLNNFAYRIDLSLDLFFYTGVSVLLIVLLTTVYHAVKTAMTNPADVLRYE